MGLDLWFPEDVARILAATRETVCGALSAVEASCPQNASAYQKGFCDALVAVGIAFGIVVPRSLRQARSPEERSILVAGLVHEELLKRQAGWPQEGCGG